jgi:hypothetical protein
MMISVRVVDIYGGGGYSSRINQHQQDHLLKKHNIWKKEKERSSYCGDKKKKETKNKQEG